MSPIRLCLQALVIMTACGLVLLFPSSAVAAFRHRPTRWLVIVSAFLAVSAVWSATPARTAAQGLAALAMVVVVAGHAYDKGWHATRSTILRVFVAVLLGGSLLDLAAGAGVGRWSGLAGAPTQLAQLAVMTGALALVGWVYHRESAGLVIGVVGLCIVQILLSQSRVALATILTLVAVAGCLKAPANARPPLVVGFVAMVAAVVAAFANQALSLGLRDGAEAGELTELTGRTSIWPEAIELIKERPWFGSGFASGERVWADRVLEGDLNWFPSNAHNVGLELLVSVGVVGLALAAVALASVVVTRGAEAHAAAIVLVMTVLGLGATESMVHFASPTFLILALAAGAVVPERVAGSRIWPGSLEVSRVS